MPSIIVFENWPTTNWIDPAWAKYEKEIREKKNIMLMEDCFPSATKKQIAAKMGMTVGYYYQLRHKYNLTKRRLEK